MSKVYTPRLPLLYQVTPNPGNKIQHGFAWHAQYGRHAAASRLSGQILENEKLIGRPYPYCGTIKCQEELCAKDISKLWKICNRLMTKFKIVVQWIIEVSPSNKVDWHLTFRSCPADLMANGGKKLKAEIRKVVSTRLNMQFQECRNSRHWINYSLKSKISGIVKKRIKLALSDSVEDVAQANGPQWTDDIYAHKRLLFVKGCGLNKVGHIGKFWELPKAQFAKIYKDEKAKKKEARAAIPDLDGAISRLADLTDLHPKFIEKQLIRESEKYGITPELTKQNAQLADDYYMSTDDYAELMAETAAADKKAEALDQLIRDIEGQTAAQPAIAKPVIAPTKPAMRQTTYVPSMPQPAKPARKKSNLPKPARIPFDPAHCWSFDDRGILINQPLEGEPQ